MAAATSSLNRLATLSRIRGWRGNRPACPLPARESVRLVHEARMWRSIWTASGFLALSRGAGRATAPENQTHSRRFAQFAGCFPRLCRSIPDAMEGNLSAAGSQDPGMSQSCSEIADKAFRALDQRLRKSLSSSFERPRLNQKFWPSVSTVIPALPPRTRASRLLPEGLSNI